MERRADGTTLVRSAQALGDYDRAVGDWLVRWAALAPDRPFLAERAGTGWRAVTYRESLDAARSIGESLLARGLTVRTPVAILSGNSVSHALVALGAMHAGIPVAPISPAYSLVSRDHAKLQAIVGALGPGLVFADDSVRFGRALDAIGATPTPLEALRARRPGTRVDEAFASITPDTIAKVLHTSGSTDSPKGVTNTHRMLCSSQQGWAQLWPFLDETPPILCDWLPWHHTVGGNGAFNLVLRNGGTLYVDEGRPTEALIGVTARNLREIAPTLYFNVPRGFDLLLPLLEADPDLRRAFYSRLEALYYTAAALPQNLWDRLTALPNNEGRQVPILSGWGSTETTLSTRVHYPIDRPGNVGNPGPGVEIKLVPSGNRHEARVRGPNVTPGYYRRPDLTREAFDEEGFYRTGDAIALADPDDPARGLIFEGRVAEDFKLSSGTWVHVGAVRVALIAACQPLLQDAVITGHDRDEVGALVFLDQAAVHTLGLDPAAVRRRLQQALARIASASTGSSTAPARLLILDEPPSLDDEEITDKGYLNQRAVLTRRAARVDELHAGGPQAIVV